MPYTMISHKIANYAKWKRGVNAFAKVRKAAGEKSFYVARCAKNPNHVMVWCEWENTARLKKFLKSADLRKAMKGAGVISKPEIGIFKSMEDLTAR
ncbi:MAG: hypothetical protein EPO07_19495 [Verrucomicrobia bacterium]|nr:MAG: hypothetical protein EPO07_19495 [Verrucomicrobiota bacterium]